MLVVELRIEENKYHNKMQNRECRLWQQNLFLTCHTPTHNFYEYIDYREISEVSIPHVKMETLLLYHPKMQEFLKRTFLETIKIKKL